MLIIIKILNLKFLNYNIHKFKNKVVLKIINNNNILQTKTKKLKY